MKKIMILMVSLCVVLMSFPVLACTEDCNKECDYKTSHAEGEIVDSCEGWASFNNRIAAVAGDKPTCGDEWIDQCVIDARASYKQDCMEGCDKCKDDKDFLSGCFIDSASSKNGYAQ